MSRTEDVLRRFSPATREWFSRAFAAPTSAQAGAWDAVSSGANALVVAPTGSGKTLAAFLWALDRLAAGETDADAESADAGRPSAGAAAGRQDKAATRVLYISPLKALAVDVERNLRAPLVGISQTARGMGLPAPHVRVGVRSGDTSPAERRSLVSRPPDILITTPESLFLMLTSAARESLASVDTVIVDEVHAVAGTKRGAHLALSLERLDAILESPAQRIGLSATVRPQEEIARFLGGKHPVRVVAPEASKTFDLRVVVPVEDMTELGASPPVAGTDKADNSDNSDNSIWPHVEESIVKRVLEHKSSIVFANSRRLAERLTSRFNEIYSAQLAGRTSLNDRKPAVPPPAQMMAQSETSYGAEPLLARAHHGSVSKEQRALIEDDLKSGRLRCVVATSSLELGIDMGAVDLVVQVESPPSVASGLQRIGRAGHQVGEISRGVIYPKQRTDLVHAAVTAERMVARAIESMSVPRNPLDVLAQQTVAAAAMDTLDVDDWFTTVRMAAPFATLPRSVFDATLDLLAGRYPSDEFAELRPRVVWDREAGTVTGRPGAQRLAVTSGGTIPDRGMFGVFMVGEKASRVGELDEEMVYESRVGDVFALGATSWKIQDITHDRVLVSPAFGQPGRLPFWLGDNLGRPFELGEALGVFTREVAGADKTTALRRAEAAGLDEWAANNLVTFLRAQQDATRHVPSDRMLVVERFRDELGDWRVVLHSPFGTPVHAPWALAIGARLQERYGIDGAVAASDDGIVLRVPDMGEEPPGAELFVFEPEELEALVTEQVGGSALFASRFRECAARALLLPRRNPGRRSPLWQQRQRSAQLLDVARKYPSFPIILETVRECLQDVYDVPSLLGLARRISARDISLAEVTTETASPFAQALLFGYVASFMYDSDSPLAERRAAALSLDTTLLSELLGRADLRELLDEQVIGQTERELQHLAPDRRARTAEELADLLRLLGPLTIEEVAARCDSDLNPRQWLDELRSAKRILEVPFAGGLWWVPIEDAARLRDGLGVPPPAGIPAAFLQPVGDPLGDVIGRYARTHGPFTADDVAVRFGIGVAVALETLRRLAADRRVVEGEFRPGHQGSEWCDTAVLSQLRRRSLAALRNEVEPVPQAALGRFLPAWQHVGSELTGADGVLTVLDQLAGVPAPASAWESLILASRVADYSPAMLDELTANGEVVWSGAGSLPGRDGWISLHPAETLPLSVQRDAEFEPNERQRNILDTLGGGGAFFFRQLSDAIGSLDDESLHSDLWDLVWAGYLSNDTFAPLRSLIGGGKPAHSVRRRTPRARSYRSGLGRAAVPSRTGPPSAAGRWSLLPEPEPDPTLRAHAMAEQLLDRHGIVLRGSVTSEGITGGFALAYKVLSGFEDSGRCRRGYFVEGLGAAQFAAASTIDRLRRYQSRDSRAVAALETVTLAATDPANPYGAALPWPVREAAESQHRPGRKAGALVVLCDGELTLYVERGGRTVLTFTEDEDSLKSAIESLAGTVKAGGVEKLVVEKADGEYIGGTRLAVMMEAAGFYPSPKGLRIRA
ncbi:ATP-dependent helicase [Saxibacter everestensis]|uniref:ATP-dependent helicase n=1 Tax=Saxibacter everestensis TaxID=2909229 RepID=A0ABY8QQ59_9MICO|nr:ATP-dependent helicase [Brevibacteriaceae bacterium ZFBP1038]